MASIFPLSKGGKEISLMYDIISKVAASGIIIAFEVFSSPKPRELSWTEIDRHVPWKEETISFQFLLLQSIVIPCVIIGRIIYLKRKKEPTNDTIDYGFQSRTTTIRYPYCWRQLRNCYRSLLSYFSVVIIVFAIVEPLKYLIGRPRPFFLQLCYGTEQNVPELLDIPSLLTNNDCMAVNNEVKELELNRARLSFPSGHTAIATSTSVWFGLLVYEILQYFWVPLYKGVASSCFVFFLCHAIWVGSSRITDNMHHPTDVLAGFIIGLVVAIW